MASVYSWLRLMVSVDVGPLRPAAAVLTLRLTLLQLAAVLELVLAVALLVLASELEQPASPPPSPFSYGRSHGRIARPLLSQRAA
jgi:hypothetical protein